MKIIGCAFLLMFATCVTHATTQTFYIAPNGNDAWSGTCSASNLQKTDGPFATLQRAINAARGGQVEVRGGIYFFDKPVVFTPQNNGLTLTAFRNEKPVFSGGRHIIGWQHADDGVWSASVPVGSAFHELWVNGVRRVCARHPNSGYLKVSDPIEKNDWKKGSTMFRFCPGDLHAWQSLTNAELIVMNRWAETRVPIADVTESNCVVRLGRRTLFQLDKGDLYWIENCHETFDAPGEWYLDRAAGKLFYRPMPDEDMTKAEVIAPALSQLIRLEGTERMTFRGVTFAHTEWYFPPDFKCSWPSPDVQGFSQAAFGVPGSVFGDGVRGCRFESCVFEHIGNYGLELARGSQSNSIVACEFRDLGAGGIKLGETKIRQAAADQSFSNEISDCRIHDGGKLFASAVGIWIGQSHNNRIVHNLIHDFYYTGISMGWTWGYDASQAQGNIVEWNHVHHIGKLSNGDGPILSDMGGIYTLGNQQGGVIRNNLWHDIDAVHYGGWGIYFDEGTTGITAENNLIYRTKDGGFHQHYGKGNVVRNNIFAFAHDHQLQRTRPEPHLSFTFEHNIVYWNTGKLLGGNWNDDQYMISSNLFWRTESKPLELLTRFQSGYSLITDPFFVDPDHDDFTLKSRSLVRQIGFEPFDLRTVGPRR